MTTEAVEVLVRAADAGDTYLTWRWLDDLDHPRARRLDGTILHQALALLYNSLITVLPGETEEAAHERALGEGGMFTTPDLECDLAARLGAAVLPAELITEIRRRNADAGSEPRVRMRLTPSPNLARVPWEALMVDAAANRRLLDIADIVYDPPATVRAQRSVAPDPWADRQAGPAIFVIDPITGTSQLRPTLGSDTKSLQPFRKRLAKYQRAGLLHPRNAAAPIQAKIDRGTLGELLGQRPSRLFYFGHVTAQPDEPGSASLHIGDASTAWGMATPIGDHLPLSALDLLLGTTTAPPERRRKSEPADGTPGHLLWPMPPRVAVIACEGGADFRSGETFGLVMAMLNAGAELVTTTRWTMPTDFTLRSRFAALTAAASRPTTEFALMIDAAHAQSDPIATLTRWQRGQLNRWRGDAEPDLGAAEPVPRIAYTPLVWSSLINTRAPALTETVLPVPG